MLSAKHRFLSHRHASQVKLTETLLYNLCNNTTRAVKAYTWVKLQTEKHANYGQASGKGCRKLNQQNKRQTQPSSGARPFLS